ncbi:MAG: FAD-dependent oxidoreductase [Gammaproteobacteria bacterium]|nr:MAG: FAD-dependent oxidoreductase [Gammaproteobacteria bacterium]
MDERLVIVGAGHGAGQLVASLRQKRYAGQITLIGDEAYYPYQRPPLSKKFLAGELAAERLYIKPQSFYADPGVEVRLNTRIARIDRKAKQVFATDGTAFAYDRLVLALGARARKLNCEGAGLAGVHQLRSIDDVAEIRSAAASGPRVVIIGAGYIGLEVAAVMRQLGLHVTVVEMEQRVMSRVVSPEVSAFYAGEHAAHGVELLLSTGLSGFGGDGRVTTVALQHGDTLPADLVVVGIGIEANTELAAEAGLEIDDGIVVDDRCRSSDAAIFAIGDCTRHPNALLGRSLRLESVHNAVEQAKTAAANLCGETLHYAQIPWFWSDQYDLKLQIAGLSQGYDQTIIRGDPHERAFACAYLREGRLLALDAVNTPRDFMQAKALIARGAMVDLQQLADSSVALKDL